MISIYVSVTPEVHRQFVNYEHIRKKMFKVKRNDLLLKIVNEVGDNYSIEEVEDLYDKLYFNISEETYDEFLKEAENRGIKVSYMLFLKIKSFFKMSDRKKKRELEDNIQLEFSNISLDFKSS